MDSSRVYFLILFLALIIAVETALLMNRLLYRRIHFFLVGTCLFGTSVQTLSK